MLYKKGKNHPMTQAVDTFASYNLTILFIWLKFDNRLILVERAAVRPRAKRVYKFVARAARVSREDRKRTAISLWS